MSSATATRILEISRLTRRERRLILSYRGEAETMDGEPDKIAALTDTVRALEGAAVPYALIGGVAVGVHSGSPRATIDVDFAAATTCGRGAVIEVLESAGLRKTGEFPHSVNFRHRSGEPVQIAFDPSFDAIIARAERFEIEDVSVAIVRKEDLIAMKERAAADPARRKSKRLLDRADVELLRGDVPDPDEGW